MRALSERPASPEELAEVRRLLDRMDADMNATRDATRDGTRDAKRRAR
jgi:hypothetical protein